MTNDMKNVPELRFPEFEDGWKLVHLNDLGNFTSGGTPLKTKKSYWNGDIPWLTTSDINGKKIHKASNYITQEGLENSSAKLVYKESILIAMYGQGKTRGMSSILNFEAATNQACAIFQTNNDIKFMHQFLRKDYNKLRSLSNDGSQKNLSLTLLKNHQISVPKLEEQQKVGDFFSKLDRQIELEEQKLKKLEEQKKGYMQKIFSQELRFKDENGNNYSEWEYKNFLEIFKLVPSKNHQIKSSEVVENGIIPVVDQGKDIFLGYSNEKGKAIEDFDNVIVYGDHTTIVKYIKEPFIIGGDGVKLLTSNDGSLIHYLYILLQHFNVNPEGYKRHYSILKTKKMNISNTKEEQEEIGNFFEKQDNLIEKQSDKVDLLKDRKKGFLQKMFV